MTRKAYMIGAGIGSLSAAVYLIRDGGWDGSAITILGLDTHGANDGARADPRFRDRRAPADAGGAEPACRRERRDRPRVQGLQEALRAVRALPAVRRRGLDCSCPRSSVDRAGGFYPLFLREFDPHRGCSGLNWLHQWLSATHRIRLPLGRSQFLPTD